MEKEKSITFQPVWQGFFWHYLIGIVLIPLFGAGLFLIWYAYRRRSAIRYDIFDHKIRQIDGKDVFELNLRDINEVSVDQNRIEKRFDTGRVIIQANVSSIEMIGMENPESLAGTIRAAVEAEKKRFARQSERKKREPDHAPGTLDKMDYLTGLWQQGLISDEDYLQEKKHFE